jgi:RNA polymerase sigma-70 factor, ECF subfamily
VVSIEARQWLAALYERAASVAFAVAVRILRDREEAQDTLQDAFISALQLRDRFDARRGTELAWLLSIVRARSLDRLRARRVRSAFHERQLDAPLPEAAEADSMAVARLHRGFAGLPQPQQKVLVLAYFQGLTHVEIAAHLGAPLGSVKSWLRGGVAELAAELASPEEQAPGRLPPLSTMHNLVP